MKDQVLSIEQMQELIALGVDVSKASMIWYPKMAIDARTGKGYVESHYLTINHIDNEHFWNTREGQNTIPTFTLQDILEMLPSIKGYLPWDLHRCASRNPYYMCVYEPYDLEHTSSKDWIKFTSETPIEAAFNMLKWCKQNT